VEVALSAMDRHSQNDMFFDPTSIPSITDTELRECDDIIDWAGIPFTSKSSLDHYLSIVSV